MNRCCGFYMQWKFVDKKSLRVFGGYDCSSWTYGLTSDDLDCLTKEQWLNDKVLLNAKQ